MSYSKTITLFYALLYLKNLVHMRNVIFPLQCQVYKRYGTSSNLKNPGSKCIILKKKDYYQDIRMRSGASASCAPTVPQVFITLYFFTLLPSSFCCISSKSS